MLETVELMFIVLWEFAPVILALLACLLVPVLLLYKFNIESPPETVEHGKQVKELKARIRQKDTPIQSLTASINRLLKDTWK